METTSAANNLCPRKQVRLHLRPDLLVEPHRFQGRLCYVVKDPVRLRYFRFKEQEHFLLRQLEAGHTLEQARQAFERHFRPIRLSACQAEEFARGLVTCGLASPHTDSTGSELLARRQKQRGQRWLTVLQSVLYCPIPLGDPDEVLARWATRLRWLFTPAFFMAGLGLMLAALLLVAANFDGFLRKLPARHEFFTLESGFWFWLALGVVKVCHELGHGLTCKALGGEVHEMGMLLLCLSPCLYCNVSDSWRLPNKWARIAIGFAGIYVEMLIAAAAVFVWWLTPGQPLVHHLCLSLAIVCTAGTLLFNANPLMRFDGYYILADWLEVPNLRDRCHRLLASWLEEKCLGLPATPEPSLGPMRRLFFMTYAAAMVVYGWIVLGSILWFLGSFLRPYRLGTVGALLAGAVGALAIGGAGYRLVRQWRERRLPMPSPPRLVIAGSVLGAALLAAWLVPLPAGIIHQTGLIQVTPAAEEWIVPETPGLLERLHVRNGQAVQTGDLLAEFSNPELETRRAEACTERDIRTARLTFLRQQTAIQTEQREVNRLAAAVSRTAGERTLLERQIDAYEKMLAGLGLRASRAGVVLGLPLADDVGKPWGGEGSKPLCRIVEPGRWRAVVPLSPADYRLLREEQNAAERNGTEVRVTLRVQGRSQRAWPGRLADLPEGEAAALPLALASVCGGPVQATTPPTAPAAVPQTCAPLQPHYLIAVEFLPGDPPAYSGCLVQVAIRGRARPAAWWLRRWLAETFDLGGME